MNDIQRKPSAQKVEKLKKKLSLFLDKPTTDFDEIVSKNPTLRFREMLKLLKEEGIASYEEEDLRSFKLRRKEFRIRQRVERGELCSEEKRQKREAKLQKREFKNAQKEKRNEEHLIK